MSNCTDCLLDLTDACPRGSGRAIDDEICDNFISRETYQVNKNDSWQLGYQQGRADAIEIIYKWVEEQSRILRLQSDTSNDEQCFGGWRAMENTKRYLENQLKEQTNE